MNRNRKKLHKNEAFKKWLALTLTIAMTVASGITTFGTSLTAEETDPYSETAATEQTSDQTGTSQDQANSPSAVTQDEETLPKDESSDDTAAEDSSAQDEASDQESSDEAAGEEADKEEEEKDTKDTYTYSDEHLRVTAVLSDASAVPDDAELRVTKIDSDTEGYNYEAYVKAIDEKEGSDSVEDSDHVFYDVAFIGTEDGREVEYEPEEGTVKVSFEFLDDQLSDELGAEKAGDIEVKHLTIPSDVLSEAGTTKDATDISASDVTVRNIDADITLSGDESAEFRTDDFSVFYFEKDQNGKTKKQANTWNDKDGDGVDFTIDEVINGINANDDVLNYAVYANKMENMNKHVEGNIKVGSLEAQGTGPLNQDGAVFSRTAVTKIHVAKELDEAVKADTTFDFGVYRAGKDLTEENRLAKFSITVKKGEKSGDCMISRHDAALTDQAEAENAVFSELGDNNVVIYELDKNGTPVMANKKNGDYVVAYTGNEVSSSRDVTRFTNYIGTICNANGHVEVEPNFFNNGRSGVMTYIENMTDEELLDSNGRKMSDAGHGQGQNFFFTSGGTKVTVKNVNTSNRNNIDIQQQDGITESVKSSLDALKGFSVSLANAHNGAKSGYRSLSVINMTSTSGNLINDFTAANLNDNNNMVNGNTIKGMLTENGFLLINIDATGHSTYTLDKFVVDGSDPDGSNEELSRHVIYNFIQKSADGSYEPYTGSITVNNVAGGVILAPSATVIHNGGIRGEIIADSYDFAGGSELHKDTLTEQKTAEVKVGNGTEGKSSDVEANITAKKTLDGKTPDAGRFSFELKGEDGTVLQTKQNGADGSVVFDPIKYAGDKDADYHYTISEVVPENAADNIKYDETSHKVTVTVKDGAAKVTYDDGKTEAPTFANTTTKKASVKLSARKVFSGKALSAGMFSFELKDSGGTVLQTKTNGADGSIDFDALTFDKCGTYKFTISEKIPADSEKLEDVLYDDHVCEVTVKVDKDENGDLTASAEYGNGGSTFTNKYEKSVTTASISAMKKIDGRDLTKDDKFKFTLKAENGAPMPSGADGDSLTVTNDGSDIDFGSITYDKIGEYKYRITEEKYSANGITSDDSTKEVTVNVTKENGKLRATVTGDGKDAVFTNKYRPEAAYATVTADKKLTGRDLQAGEFSFELLDSSNNVVDTASNDSKGGIRFKSIRYEKPGTYTYTIKEVDGKLGGIKYDSTGKKVTVTVTDDKQGKLSASVEGDGKSATFENTYHAKSTDAEITAMKNLTGRTKALGAGEFSFTLTAKDNAPMPEGSAGRTKTVSNDGSGLVDFGSIRYDKAGTYAYEIKENAGTKGGVNYDTSVKTVTVKVTDDNNGQLKAAVQGAGTAATFNNTYEAAHTNAEITARKTLNGRDLKDGEFSFTLTAQDNAPMPEGSLNGRKTVKNSGSMVDFGSVEYDKAGTYRYTISEDAADKKGGVKYDSSEKDVTVKVVDNDNGTLSATVTGAGESAVFTNSYTSSDATADITAVKNLSGRTLESGEFSFTLTAVDNAPMPDGARDGRKTVTNSGAAVDFGQIAYKNAGTYKYTITENSGKKGGVTYDESTKNVTVTVTDNGDGTKTARVTGAGQEARFNNTYTTTPTTAKITAKKTLEGRDLRDGEFSFTLRADGNAPMPDGAKDGEITVKNGADGKINFGSITYKEAGTYTYKIKEVKGDLGGVTYDDSEKTVTVNVTDNNDGTMKAVVSGDGDEAVFTNTYKTGTAETEITAVKKLKGRTVCDGEFSFKLTAQGDAPMPEGASGGVKTVTNKGEAVNFGKITYDKAGEYHYQISEVKGSLGGVKYDETTKDVTVTVKDNGDGTLTASIRGAGTDAAFNNTYAAKPAKASINAKKSLSGRDIKDGEFSFMLTAVKDAPMPEAAKDGSLTVTNKDEDIDFGEITYYKAGTYTYRISEVNTGLGGVTYDSSVKTVTVNVKDNLDGTMTATVDGDGSRAQFNNIYRPAPTSASITARKNLSGRALKDDEFSFTLSAKNGAPMPAGARKGKLTVANRGKTDGGLGIINFGSITYDRAGKYEYTITENSGSKGGVTYDGTTKDVTVTVKDNGDGTMTAKVDGAGSSAVFENAYTPSETKASIKAEKTLTGRDLKDGEFSFTLSADSDGAPMPEGTESGTKTVSNSGSEIDFGDITFTEAGTYDYTVSEVKGDKGGVSYDASTHQVTIKVTDDGNGNLTAATDYNGWNGKFNNTYKTGKVRASISATKSMTGRTLEDGEFSFTLTAKDGAPMPAGAKDGSLTVTNSGSAVSFGSIEYSKAGEYEYTISEDRPQGLGEDDTYNGIRYDSSTKNVVVTVSDNGNGGLTADVKYDGKDSSEFTNEYTAEKTSAVIKAHKSLESLEGRALESGEFSFELLDSDGNVISTASNDSEGNIAFAPIEYTKAGTYDYTVREVAGSDKTVKYDKSEHKVTVEVKDDGKGQLTAEVNNGSDEVPEFVNRVKKKTDASVQLGAMKTLENKKLTEGDYTFELRDSDGNVVDTATNAADGTVLFKELTYAEAGTYEYTISEKLPEGVSSADPVKDGVRYDTTSHKVIVTVSEKDDEDSSTLTADVKYDGGNEKPVFTNKYSTEKGKASITAKKVLKGKKLEDGEFTFRLTESGENPEETLEDGSIERTNDADGTIDFGEIKYSRPGVYTYSIEEKNDAQDSVTYDENKTAVKVEVTDDGKGSLETKVTYNGSSEPATFTNTYDVKPGIVRFSGIKAVTEGNTAGDISGLEGLFRFNLSENGTVIDTAKNDADGRFYFKNLRFDSDEDVGTHTYTISEQHAGETRVVDGRKITYDSKTYTVTVKVDKDVESGRYVAAVSGDTGSFDFSNRITEDDKVTVRANKQLIGGTLKGGEFTFELYRKNAAGEAVGDPVAVTTNTSDGSIIFEEMDSCDTGFVIREVKGSDSSISYDISDHPVDFSDGEQTSVPTITNTTQKIVVRLKKSSIDPTSGNEPLYKAVYALHRINSAGEDELVEEQTSDENGYMYYTKLEPGYVYYFREVSAPAGHTVEPAPSQYFKIVSTGSGIRAVPCDRNGNATGGSDYTISLENSGSISIVKDKDDITESSSQYYYEDSDVKASAKSLVSGALPEGAKLKVEKLAAGSEAYEKALSRIDSSSVRGTALSLYNVYFVTEDGTKVEPDAGSVSVTIQDKSEPAVSSKDSLGIVHISGNGSVSLLDGTVAVSDGRAEQGTFSSEDFSVFGLMEVESSSAAGGELVIDTDGVQDHVTELKVGKRDSISGEYVGGAKLQILRKEADGSETLIREWTSSDVGRESFTKLLDVNTVYILREVQAPAGYDTAPDTEFSIDDYGNVGVYTNEGQVSYDHAQRTEVADSASLDLFDVKLAVHKTVINKKYVRRNRVVRTYKPAVKYETVSSGSTTGGGSNAQALVKTGDTMDALFWAVALLAAADVLLVMSIRRRRGRKNRTEKASE
jgi:pilin isopeptide linkage protein